MSDFETRKSVVYCTHDGVSLEGDLYLPRGGNSHPAIIAVHGGAWRRGSRTAFDYWGPHLAARGYAVFAISYRLSTPSKKTYPQVIHDVIAAIQFIRGEAQSLNIDPERIVLMGASAGAHLSALVGLATQSGLFTGAYPQDKHASMSAKVKAIIGVYGVYDTVDMWATFHNQIPTDNSMEHFLGVSPMEDRKLYFDASPISYATFANNKVSALLVWGEQDDLVNPDAHSRPFTLALKRAGFFVRSVVLPAAPHYWIGDPIDETDSFTGFLAPRLIRFLRERV